MAYQAIGRGTSANDGTGDDLRSGAGKINANFVEVYTKLGDGSTLTTDTVTLNTATQTLTNKTLTAPTITGAGAIAGVFTGNLTGNVSGNLTGSVTGNADTATALAVARTIAGKSFDGTANITIAAQDLSDVNQDLATTDAVQFQGITSRGDGASAQGQIVLNCETNAHGQTIISQPHSAAVTNTLTLPAGGNQELVGTDATQILTNKTLTSPTITGSGAIAGTFTGNVTGNIDGIVGGSTPAAGSFTTVSLSDFLQLAVFADGTARDAAITSPAAGMLCFVNDNGSGAAKAQVYDGSAWADMN